MAQASENRPPPESSACESPHASTPPSPPDPAVADESHPAPSAPCPYGESATPAAATEIDRDWPAAPAEHPAATETDAPTSTAYPHDASASSSSDSSSPESASDPSYPPESDHTSPATCAAAHHPHGPPQTRTPDRHTADDQPDQTSDALNLRQSASSLPEAPSAAMSSPQNERAG